jgi:hypothetical protein
VWRQEHLNRDMTDMLLSVERRGRWPVRFEEARLPGRSAVR